MAIIRSICDIKHLKTLNKDIIRHQAHNKHFLFLGCPSYGDLNVPLDRRAAEARSHGPQPQRQDTMAVALALMGGIGIIHRSLGISFGDPP